MTLITKTKVVADLKIGDRLLFNRDNEFYTIKDILNVKKDPDAKWQPELNYYFPLIGYVSQRAILRMFKRIESEVVVG